MARYGRNARLGHNRGRHRNAGPGRQDRLLRSSLARARDPDARAYTDQALTPGHDDDVILDLLTKTTGARAAVAHLKKIAGLTGPGRAA
jgi:hypothetical protein